MIDGPAGAARSALAPDGTSALFHKRLVSEGALAQLILCFIISPLRADPFLCAPLIALYAIREEDCSALLLYRGLSLLGGLLDLAYLVRGNSALSVLSGALQLLLKVALVYPLSSVQDILPVARPERGSMRPEQLQQAVASAVKETLAAAVQERSPRRQAPTPTLPKPLRMSPMGALGAKDSDGSWEQV